MRNKDYWKGRPKLQAWFKSKEDAEALRLHFEHARAGGLTRARAPGGWVAEWIVGAAAGVSRGEPGAPPREREDAGEALDMLARRYGVTDAEEMKRLLVTLTARALRAGRDPFAVPVAVSVASEPRRA